MKDSLIVLSGGLDSTTMLYEYQYRIGMAVSFHYGSNHNDRELEFAKLHCERLGIPHMVVRLPFIKQFSNPLCWKERMLFPRAITTTRT